jgi:16S rRNA processing protein RimM
VTDEPDFVVIGLLRRAHGVKGELSVQPVSNVPERFNGLGAVLVRQNGSVREVAVEAVRTKGKSVLVKLEGVDDRTSAEMLAGAELGVRRRDVWPVPEGTYYVFDLVGCRVMGGAGREIGVIEEVWTLPANDVFVVRLGSKEILIPAVKTVVKQVDLEARVVLIEEMEGLLD